MAQHFPSFTDELTAWIAEQHVFFVATAAATGRVNVSPKGQDVLRVTNANEVVWLNLTGSGNESAAHVLDTNRMTLMWCSFAGPPRIVRAYGSAAVIRPGDAAWDACAEVVRPLLGARQYFRMTVDLVQVSCGYAVPRMDFVGERDTLSKWSANMGASGIEQYWTERNRRTIDGFPTGC